MEEIRIGVIGTGRIGVEHIRRINTGLSGARVTAVASSTPARAGEVAARFAIPHAMEAETLIASPGVDAVMITSPGASHEAYALACLRARKPVFCEKPLAMTAEAGLSVVRAECAVGRRLIQLGFMRRFDQHHLELRQLLAGGSLGRALMVHATHRNPNNANFNDTMEIVDTAIHELDVLPWLLGDPVVSCQALYGAAASCIAGQQHDPMLLLLRTASGVLIDLDGTMASHKAALPGKALTVRAYAVRRRAAGTGVFQQPGGARRQVLPGARRGFYQPGGQAVCCGFPPRGGAARAAARADRGRGRPDLYRCVRRKPDGRADLLCADARPALFLDQRALPDRARLY